MATTQLQPEAFLPRFGLSTFREGQRRVIGAVLSGVDCLCIMPTGGGKSLCYQLPALMLDGLTLVVSPLIALMKDQVDQLCRLGLPASFVNSHLTASEQFDRLERMAAGEYRLVYVSPERFRNERFLAAVRKSRLKLLAVDEAHCISEWGHDFRPDYARLGYYRRLLGNPPTIALTATATDVVRRDIIEQLGLREPATFITGFARPNLYYEVRLATGDVHKQFLLLDFLRGAPGSGIIYTSSRKRTEELASVVAGETARPVVVYHAGLSGAERKKAQEDFMCGRSEIVVATVAFGMGIDKPDVRFVVHYNLPGSIEAYYQEAGRAGRDGLPAHCLLLFHPSDRYIQEYFIESAYPEREYVEAVYDFLCGREENPIQITQEEVRETLKLPITSEGVGNCEQILESAGVLERLTTGENMAAVRLDGDLPTFVDLLPKQAKTLRKVLRAVEQLVGRRRHELVSFQLRRLKLDAEVEPTALSRNLHELSGKLSCFTYIPPFRGRAIRMIRRDLDFDKLDIDFAAIRQRKNLELKKLDSMIAFAYSSACRQAEILRYFGEPAAKRCGHCDNCRPRTARRLPPVRQTSGKKEETVAKKESREISSSGEILDAEILQLMRTVLNGAALVQARFPCGKRLIVQMLCGSRAAKVKKLGLNKLRCFGSLSQLRQDQVGRLIDALVSWGCLQQVDLERFRPVLELTKLGEEVLRGETTLRCSRSMRAKLLKRLGLPRSQAAEDATSAPKSRSHRPEKDIQPITANTVVTSSSPPHAAPKLPVHYWTQQLLRAGFSVEECMSIRGLPRETVLAHARMTESERPPEG